MLKGRISYILQTEFQCWNAEYWVFSPWENAVHNNLRDGFLQNVQSTQLLGNAENKELTYESTDKMKFAEKYNAESGVR